MRQLWPQSTHLYSTNVSSTNSPIFFLAKAPITAAAVAPTIVPVAAPINAPKPGTMLPRAAPAAAPSMAPATTQLLPLISLLLLFQF